MYRESKRMRQSDKLTNEMKKHHNDDKNTEVLKNSNNTTAIIRTITIKTTAITWLRKSK